MLTLDESAQLMNDQTFRGRVKAACISFAGSVLAAPGSVSLFTWAKNCYQNPDGTAAQVVPPAVMNINVQQAGGSIDDNSLLATVQYVVQGLT